MDKDFALNKWVPRLRDPAAVQARMALRRTGGGMCCLGHVCDLVDMDNWEFNWDTQEYSFFGHTGVLPKQVSVQLEMKSDVGNFSTGHSRRPVSWTIWEDMSEEEKKSHKEGWYSLANLNDAGFTLPMIADIVEYFHAEI